MNYYKKFDFREAENLIYLAIKEDRGNGDITSKLLIPEKNNSKAELLLKENGVIAGLEIFNRVFKIIDPKIKTQFFKSDGESLNKGEIIGLVKGNTRNLLLGERIALNILQRMSGIATQTDILTKKLNNPNIKIIDTRKTTPNFRLFEKLAVRIGGGENHRFGLYDMILIKDNHIEANGGIANTILSLKKNKKNLKCKTEIEVKNLGEFRIVLLEGKGIIDRVMLDNFNLKEVKEAVTLNNNYFEIELSGGIDSGNISKYSNIEGISYISSGSLTHSVNSLDISFNFIT
ncbi:MAG TPA: carboxylating nicotinate-nucleotide diphosphorylase [Ignavibacteria bacterium]|nr:carboxylating nicotinate-nucleotide diphosphorylase [Ignavibacteria bacterium]